MSLTYSNPRMAATFEDWPYGQLRTRCTFTVTTKPGKGERAERVTVNPKNGRPGAAKTLTYADKMRIVDGSDGKTYIAALSRTFGMVSVMQSNMQFQEEVIHKGDGQRWADVQALFTVPGVSLYERLKAAGVEIDNHETDLYFPDTQQTRAIVAACMAEGVLMSPPQRFKSQHDGSTWFDAAFQFTPEWEARAERKVGA